jgi:hypothetical protein
MMNIIVLKFRPDSLAKLSPFARVAMT